MPKRDVPESMVEPDDTLARVWGEPALPDWHARVLGRSLGQATDKAVRQGRDLINAAARLMSRLDSDELTMQGIAAEAGVSVRVLYRHFEGKDDLLVALIEESQLVFARLIEKETAGLSDPLERLGEALHFATRVRHQTDQNFSRSMARYTVQTTVNAPERVGAAHHPVILVLTEMVQQAMDSGQVEAGNAEVAAANIYNAYMAHQRNVHLGNSLGGPLPSAPEFVRFCLLGLGAHIAPGWETRLGAQKRRRASAAS